MPVATTTQIEAAVTGFREDFKLFLEVPVQANPQPLIAAISGTRAAAKIRTGGIVESAIPPSTQIVNFMQACIDAGVEFKATAGLHHAVRGKYRLTYEAGSACAMMHGYVNVFLAAAFCAAGASDTALAVLEETDASAFHLRRARRMVERSSRGSREPRANAPDCCALVRILFLRRAGWRSKTTTPHLSG